MRGSVAKPPANRFQKPVKPKVPNQLRTVAVKNAPPQKFNTRERAGDIWENKFFRIPSPSVSASTMATVATSVACNVLDRINPLKLAKILANEAKAIVRSKYPGDQELLTMIRQVYYLTRSVENVLTGVDLPTITEEMPQWKRSNIWMESQRGHKRVEVEKVEKETQHDGDLVKKHDTLLQDMNVLLLKLESFDQTNKKLETNLKNLKEEKELLNVNLNNRTEEVEILKANVSILTEQLKVRDEKISQLHKSNQDLMTLLKTSEAETLKIRNSLDEAVQKNQAENEARIQQLEEKASKAISELEKLSKAKDKYIKEVSSSLDGFGELIDEKFAAMLYESQEAYRYKPRPMCRHSRLRSIVTPSRVHSGGDNDKTGSIDLKLNNEKRELGDVESSCLFSSTVSEAGFGTEGFESGTVSSNTTVTEY